MIKYIHTFRVSSGKGYKVIEKVYTERNEAYEKHQLIGGKLETVEVIDTFEVIK